MNLKMSYPHTQEEDEDVPSAPAPPPGPFAPVFVFPQPVFGGWPNFTPGTGSQGGAIRTTINYQITWEPNHYYEYGNGNGEMRTQNHSADQEDYTQFTENSFMDESRESGQRNNEWRWRCLEIFRVLLAMSLVICGMVFLTTQLYESPPNVDTVSNFPGGKLYCTCDCEDLLDLFALRNFYESGKCERDDAETEIL